MTEEAQHPPELADTGRGRIWAKRLGWAIAIVFVPILLIAAFLSSPIGKRFVADQIADVSPASGLRFEVGRIEGDIYGRATLHDVIVKDPQGTFLTIPEVELDWRPLAWLWSGIDVRELTARRGTLSRFPELLPGDPDAPILPDFDIRIDRFEIDNLTLAEGVAGDAAQRIDFDAGIDIRDGRTMVMATGQFGPEDGLFLMLDAEPDADRFNLTLDYSATQDGPAAALMGLDARYLAQIEGEGTWTDWLGHGLVTRIGDYEDGVQQRERVAGFRLTNHAGEFGLLGQVAGETEPTTISDRALGEAVSLALTGTLEDSIFDGRMAAVTSALDMRGAGTLNLAENAADGFELNAVLRDPNLLAPTAELQDARLTAMIDGPFRGLNIDHQLTAETLTIAETVTVQSLAQSGVATFDGETLRVPLDATARRAISGIEAIDPRLVDGTLTGLLTYSGGELDADNALLSFPGLNARLTLRGNTQTGAYAIAAPIEARGLQIENVGRVNANAKLLAKFGSGFPWTVNANVAGRLVEVTNASIENVAGGDIAFRGSVGVSQNSPIVMRNVEIDSERVTARLDSRLTDSRTILAGNGEHVQYGPFSFDAELEGSTPRGVLLLANPYPDAGLADVRIGIAPSEDGFALDVEGGSLLGPFNGGLDLVLPTSGSARVDIEQLEVYRTNVTGALTLLGEDRVAGDLQLAGGGLDGTIRFSPGEGDAQNFDLDLAARQARFGGEQVIALDYADILAEGSFTEEGSRVDANISGRGLEYGALRIASFAADAAIVDGRGDVTASIAGRRADRFALKLDGDLTPERIALIAQGEYGGRPISMPRRAILTALEGGGYRLAPTQIGYDEGFTIVEGQVGGDAIALEVRLASMPLRLIDLAGSDLGLGGRMSGVALWNQQGEAAPTGNARVRIDDFTRSGLVLSSRPINVFAVADLAPNQLSVGARLIEGEGQLGRVDARISGIGGAGSLSRRIMRGRLSADLGYDGPAQSLWRLAAIETFDLTGPLAVSATATGSLENPRLSGNLSSDDLRLQSAISGTDIANVSARGRFSGSRLELTRFSGSTRGDGTVNGSGTVDFADMSDSRGPRIDLRAAVAQARLLNANGLEATISGPLRIVSDGAGGAIAGRVTVDRASWALGVADEDLRLPTIATREINRPDPGSAGRSTATGSWRYLVDAEAPRRVAVDGLGLDSEWGVDIALRGTVDNPRIGGEARLVRGDYTFAGTRFELTDGRIVFDENGPIDPRLDIEAEASANGTDVTIAITGNAQAPQIAFSSSPALPQEEILARLLFGGSVTSLTATDAVQLAAALAALQGGGGGLDPIGDLRRSIGLDQLRIVSADPAIGRGTGVALGKNIGRRAYVELVTDGQGYSATQLEYRITSWLALLGSVSTIGRDSVLIEVSRDY